MRITSGVFKGTVLRTPSSSITRPTAEKVRQALFNMYQYEIENGCFLDVCAGSGAIGIEAISRGARQATFIEQDRIVCAVIKENIRNLKIENQTKILCLEAMNGLKALQGGKYDFIYADPPYKDLKDEALVLKILSSIDEFELLSDNGFAIIETQKMHPLPNLTYQTLLFERKKVFGDSALLIFKKRIKD